MRAMKDSGIEWIGQIPQEWKTIRLRSRFSFGKGLPITKADLTESGIGVVSYGQIHSKANIGTTIKTELVRYVDSKYLATNESSLASNGDFIFADTSEDISGCGNCVYVDVDYPMFAGYHTMILRSKNELSTKYYSYLFVTDAWRSQIRAQASGVKLFSITQKMLRDTLLIEPSEEEKDCIVLYLDDKCAAIDELIAAKEKTNALLRERRQSIIYEAVTKGLNPNAPMKDSGIEWIGEIPEEWETRKIKYCFEVYAGATPKSGNSEFWDGDIIWVTPADYTTEQKYISASRKNITQEGFESCSTELIPAGSLIFSKRAPIGLVAINTVDMCTNQGCLSCVPSANNDVEYFYYAFSCFTEQFDLYGSGTTFKEISADAFMNFTIPYPAPEVQRQISDYLRAKCAEMDTLISANEATIQKLKEYRQSIIYEAVTGKIEI